MSLEVFRQHFGEIKATFFPEPDKLRFINWYLLHGCNLSCNFCKVPRHPADIMNREQKQEALGKLRQLSTPGIPLSILGGEPTAKPILLTEAVKDAADAGFFVCLVSNGWKLSSQLIEQLGDAGLKYLGLSIDYGHGDNYGNYEKKFKLLKIANEKGIVPVVNTVLTKQTDTKNFRQLIDSALKAGLFVNPIVCSPEVPDGSFSNASIDSLPTYEQLRALISWLAWQKLKTGRVTSSFNYLKTLFDLYDVSDEGINLWHCSPNFRQSNIDQGRGFLTLDSDGYIGPCQEYPRAVQLLDIPINKLSLKAIDTRFSQITQKCPGCLYNCFYMEENIKGLTAVSQFQEGIQIGKVLSKRT